MAVDVDTVALASIGLSNDLVLVKGLVQSGAVEVVDVAALTNLTLGHGSGQVATSLRVSLLVGSVDKVVVVHDIVPQGKLHLVDQGEHAVLLILSEEAFNLGEVGTVAHASGDGVTVEHTSG